MHLTRMGISRVPPFTEAVKLKFDEQINVFIGPNASGKSTILMAIADCFNGPEQNTKRPISQSRPYLRTGVYTDDELDETVSEYLRNDRPAIILTSDNVWSALKNTLASVPESMLEGKIDPPVVYIGSVREGLPGASNQESLDSYDKTVAEVLKEPFSGSRTMLASKLLIEELYPNLTWQSLLDGMELADTCSKRICDEVIRDSKSSNYIPNPMSIYDLYHPATFSKNIKPLPLTGINTSDIRNFGSLPNQEQPAFLRHNQESDEHFNIYLGHLSSGTEGTLLWIRWLALQMFHYYEFKVGWAEKPAILLIDEIENHLHPTWQRRVIPALLEHFPGLQIFATTHSPFVVAGLKAGQVHLLNRDANGIVTATTNAKNIIGWTSDEILRTMMGVDDPTDDATAAAARELRQLRAEGPRDTEEAEEWRQQRMLELRGKVDRDLLAGGPMAARRELFEQQFSEIIKRYRRNQELNQENG